MKKPKEINSGKALMAAQEEYINKPRSPTEKLHMIMELMGGLDACPTCGATTERAALITLEQARELLGFDEEV